MTEIEVSETRSCKGMRWAARVISLLPGAAATLLMLGTIVYDLVKGIGAASTWGVLLSGAAYYSLPVLGLGLLAWKWPRVGGVLLILMAASVFSFAWAPDVETGGGRIYGSLLGAPFLVGGVLHLIVSTWGRGRAARVTEIEVSESRSFKGIRWAARIVSLVPWAGVVLFLLDSWRSQLRMETLDLLRCLGLLSGVIFYSLPVLSLGLLAWKSPRAGGILLILMAVLMAPGSFSLVGDGGSLILERQLLMGATFLIGGILHLITSPWGRRLWYRRK